MFFHLSLILHLLATLLLLIQLLISHFYLLYWLTSHWWLALRLYDFIFYHYDRRTITFHLTFILYLLCGRRRDLFRFMRYPLDGLLSKRRNTLLSSIILINDSILYFLCYWISFIICICILSSAIWWYLNFVIVFCIICIYILSFTSWQYLNFVWFSFIIYICILTITR